MRGISNPPPAPAALRLERLERLQGLTAELSAAATPQEVARAIFDRGLSLVGARAVALFWERAPGELELMHGLGLSEEYSQRYRRIGPDAPVPGGEVYRTGQPVWLGTLAALAARFPESARLAAAEGDAAWAALPLVSDRSRGALELRFDTPRAFDLEEREFVQAVARQCAQALERSRLYEGQQRLLDRLASLQAITSELSAAATPREVAAVVFRHLLGLGVKGGTIFSLLAPGQLQPVLAFEADDLRDALLGAGPSPLTDAMEDGQPVWLIGPTAVATAYPGLELLRARRGDGAWGALPLRVEGRSVGGLVMAFPEGRAPGPEDRTFAAALAQQGALALERARLYESQRQLAGRLGQLNAAAVTLSGAATPGEVVAAAFGALSELGACAAEIHGLEQPERLALLARRGAGAADGLDASAPVAEVVRTGKALWIESREELAGRFPELAAARREGAWVVVPLLGGGNTVGALAVAFPAARRLEQDERAFVRMLAMACAQALERARLSEAASQERREAEWLAALLEGALAAAPVGLVLLDREMRVVRTSARLADLSGIPAEAHRGRTVLELLAGFPGEALAHAFGRALGPGERVDQELSGETSAAPGETRRLALSWYPVRVAGEAVGVGVLVRELARGAG